MGETAAWAAVIWPARSCSSTREWSWVSCCRWPSAQAVAAAVADVGEPEGIGQRTASAWLPAPLRLAVEDGASSSDQRGAHAGELRGLAGLLVDGLVGGADGGGEACLRPGGAAAVGGLGAR